MQATEKNTALVWFTNNLRVWDNRALNEACKNHERVIGVYFLNPELFQTTPFGFKKTDRFRAQFLLESLTELASNLESLNISLLVIYKSASKAIERLIDSYSVTSVYHLKEWTSEERTELSAVTTKVGSKVNFQAYYDQFLMHPEAIELDVEALPLVFTQFRKWVEKHATVNEPLSPISKPPSNLLEHIPQIPSLQDLGFDQFEIHPNSAFPFKGGEQQALMRIEDYFFNSKKLGYYKKTRNGLLGVDYSSKLSAWLANGSISASSIYQKVKEFEQRYYSNQSTYWLIFELLWRDYFKYISLKFGNAIFHKKGIINKEMPIDTNLEVVREWTEGRTQDTFVNANMIELNETGWMSNRGRQNVASYFSRTLQQDWRIGAAYFEALLIDYDVHSNYGNWMYVSGVGNDPRSRVFNCKLQAERYDSDGRFRRQWLQTKLF